MPDTHALHLTAILSDVGSRLPQELTRTLDRYSARIVVKSADGHYAAVNQAARFAFGLRDSTEDFSQYTDDDFYSAAYAELSRKLDETVIESGSPLVDNEETQHLLHGERPRIVLASRFRVMRGANSPTEVLTISRDVLPNEALDARYRRAIAGATDGLWERNLNTNVLWFSERWAEMLGLEGPGEMTFSEFLDLVDDADRADLSAAIEEHVTDRNSPAYEKEFKVRHKKDHYVTIHSRGKVSRDHDGFPTFISGSHTDITDKDENDRLLRILSATIPSMIFLKDREGCFRFVNPALAALYLGPKQSESALIGRTDAAGTATPDQQRMFRNTDRQIIDGHNAPLVVEEAVRGHDEKDHWYRTIKVPHIWRGERCVLGIATEITDFVESKRQLALERNLLRRVMDNVPILINLKDRSGCYSEFNKYFAAFLGLTSQDQAIGKKPIDLFSKDAAREIEAHDLKILNGESVLEEYEITIQDNTRRVVRLKVTKHPITESDGGAQVDGVLTLCCPTTEDMERQSHDKAMETLMDLERQSHLQAMDTLISSLRHNFIDHFLEHIQRQLSKTSDLAGFLRCRDDWANRLKFLQKYIEKLKALTSRKKGGSGLNASRDPINLRNVVDQAIVWSDWPEMPKCENSVAAEFNLPADRMLLLLVLLNLIDNAKKHTIDKENEPVCISAAECSPVGLPLGVTISVDNCGDLLPPPEIRKKLGKEIVSLDPVSRPGKSIRGSGFGLYFCSQIVEAHGGKMLDPEDSLRGGALFRFHFPMR